MLSAQNKLAGRKKISVRNGIRKLSPITAIFVIFRSKIPFLKSYSHIQKIRIFKHVAKTVSTTANFIP